MASDLNQCSFIGRLGRDPETRHMSNGDACASFSIAVGESWKDKSSGERVEKTEWVRCVAWRQQAEIVGEYCKKGQQVFVSGKLQTRKWEKDGHTNYTTEIVIDRMQMLGGKREDSGERPERSAPTSKPAPKGGDSGFDDLESDIPF